MSDTMKYTYRLEGTNQDVTVDFDEDKRLPRGKKGIPHKKDCTYVDISYNDDKKDNKLNLDKRIIEDLDKKYSCLKSLSLDMIESKKPYGLVYEDDYNNNKYCNEALIIPIFDVGSNSSDEFIDIMQVFLKYIRLELIYKNKDDIENNNGNEKFTIAPLVFSDKAEFIGLKDNKAVNPFYLEDIRLSRGGISNPNVAIDLLSERLRKIEDGGLLAHPISFIPIVLVFSNSFKLDELRGKKLDFLWRITLNRNIEAFYITEDMNKFKDNLNCFYGNPEMILKPNEALSNLSTLLQFIGARELRYIKGPLKSYDDPKIYNDKDNFHLYTRKYLIAHNVDISDYKEDIKEETHDETLDETLDEAFDEAFLKDDIDSSATKDIKNPLDIDIDDLF